MQPLRTGLLVLVGLLVLTHPVHAQFVAFWDHVPGTNISQTHPNTTTGPILFGVGVHVDYYLKNISNGLVTPVTMRMTNSSLGSGYIVSCVNQASNPAPGTPLYNTFYYSTNVGGPTNYSFVYFGASSSDVNISLYNAAVSYIFTGLNPNARYSFKGGAVTGGTNAQMQSRWTRVEIAGADYFVPRMSSNILTSAHTTDLTSYQVAVNFACNQTPETGDMLDWEEIAPGPDGAFSVICTRYVGTVPGGSSAGLRAYAFTGIRLEETLPPLLTLSNRLDGYVTISWQPSGGILQESSNLVVWTTSVLTNGSSLPANSNRFYRVRQ